MRRGGRPPEAPARGLAAVAAGGQAWIATGDPAQPASLCVQQLGTFLSLCRTPVVSNDDVLPRRLMSTPHPLPMSFSFRAEVGLSPTEYRLQPEGA